MGQTAIIDWPIEQEYEITGMVYPGTEGRISGPPEDCYPPEDPQVDDIKITRGGKPVLESDWDRHGFTNDVIQHVIESLIEKASKDAEDAAMDEPPKRED